MGRNRGIRAGRRCLRTDGDFVPRTHALDDAGDRRRLREWLLAQPLAVSALAGAVIITVYELAVGLLVNVKFGWHVWDYSAQPGNVLGQICPTFTAIWFVVCFLFLSGVRLLMHAV